MGFDCMQAVGILETSYALFLSADLLPQMRSDESRQRPSRPDHFFSSFSVFV